jgi:hypothetical protein
MLLRERNAGVSANASNCGCKDQRGEVAIDKLDPSTLLLQSRAVCVATVFTLTARPVGVLACVARPSTCTSFNCASNSSLTFEVDAHLALQVG